MIEFSNIFSLTLSLTHTFTLLLLVYASVELYFRGKYRPPNAPPDGEKPLYLHISAGAHVSLIDLSIWNIY